VECIFQGADPEGKIPVSVLPLRDHLAQAAKRFAGSRAAAALLSAAMTWAVYRYSAALAWLERGGKTAYGGECLAALTAGFFTWQAVRRLTGKVISPAELDASVESMPGRPSVLGGTVLYYKNDTAIYWVHGESCGERAETVLFPRLEGIDFFESSWIRREGLETNKQADGDMGEPLPY